MSNMTLEYYWQKQDIPLIQKQGSQSSPALGPIFSSGQAVINQDSDKTDNDTFEYVQYK